MAKDKFDPEGTGYDMESAVAAGLKPHPESKHWQSRIASGPKEGLLLKGRKHKTWDLLVKGEEEAGYEIYKGEGGRYYSRKRNDMSKKVSGRQITKAYAAYKKRLKGLKSNKKNANVLDKAQFIAKNYPDYGKTVRTKSTEKGLKQGGLTYAEIKRLKGR